MQNASIFSTFFPTCHLCQIFNAMLPFTSRREEMVDFWFLSEAMELADCSQCFAFFGYAYAAPIKHSDLAKNALYNNNTVNKNKKLWFLGFDRDKQEQQLG